MNICSFSPIRSLSVPALNARLKLIQDNLCYALAATAGATYTFSTGLTNTGGIITANLSTGVSGGQSVVGGTASGNNLTLSSTTHATKGKILFGTSTYNEANNRLGIGTVSPSSPIHIEGTGTSELRIKTTSTNGHASLFFLTDNASANGRILVGGSTSAFSPNGVIFSSLLGPMAIVAEQSEIRFTKSTVINGSNEHARFTNSGLFGIGVTAPTAIVHIKAGTATANTAPLKLTAGTNLTTPEDGAFEFDGTNLYFTTGGVRKTVTLV